MASGVLSARITKTITTLLELSAKSWAILMQELVQYLLVMGQTINPFGCHTCTVMEQRSQLQNAFIRSGTVVHFVPITYTTFQCPVLMVSEADTLHELCAVRPYTNKM